MKRVFGQEKGQFRVWCAVANEDLAAHAAGRMEQPKPPNPDSSTYQASGYGST